MDEFKKELEDYFCRFTFGQFVTLILLEIVTLFFVFYLGARYGQDLLSGRDNVASRNGSMLPKEGPKNVEDIVGQPPVNYTYPDVLTGKDGDKAIRVKPSGLSVSEYEKQGREQNWTETPPLEEPKEARTEEPPSLDKEKSQKGQVKKEAVVAPKAGARGKFAIQVGSFQSSEEANQSMQKWKGRGYSAFMTVGEVPGKGTWYRVRIGGFPSRNGAEDFLEKFKTKEKTSALVVSTQ